MKKSLAMKILENKLVSGNLIAGEEITIKIDQTLTQDSTGTMVYLQLLKLDVDKVKTSKSVAYIDHNTLQQGFENADDHEFIKTVAARHNIIFSKAGGGICHQVHLENFAIPGASLLGSDSHTPTCGGLGALAIGAGGLDVAVAMAKGEYNLIVPKIYSIKLTGELSDKVNGKDVILTILQKLTVKGGVGYIMEYSGDGVKNLSVTDRATICNMGAELGATTSIFPSDERTLDYLIKQGREEDFFPLCADKNADYDEILELNLSEIVPMVALPHSPDNVKKISEVQGIKVDQVAIGSCTNSSYEDMMKVAKILEGNKVHPDVSLVISPGSAKVLNLLVENGALNTMIKSGARILESACGPCIGMGQAPKAGGVSLRTFNRNFKGRSGTMDAEVYLLSPQAAVYSAISGVLSDPSNIEKDLTVKELESYGRLDSYFIFPEDINKPEVAMGKNIKEVPIGRALEKTLRGTILLKTGDNVTTDDICPSNAKLLPFRSNVPELSKYAFQTLTDDFKDISEKYNGGFILGGNNYGQGSSREHAALVPLYLGVKAVIAKSFARIHKSNLINSGILPLTFKKPSDYDGIDRFDELEIEGLEGGLSMNGKLIVKNLTKNTQFEIVQNFSEREVEVLKLGGYLNYVKGQV
ncbi:MAG: aconitate hydratase [Tissierellia bacterium]|nr:aconitate hydratase [Tissierellia bacterium]